MNGNENCDDRGPRIGSEGVPRCRRPKGHDGEHRPAAGDGWGDVRWSNLTRPVTAPLPPDPADVTDGDRAKATEVLFRSGADNVARPVLALAEELEVEAQRHDDAEPITTDGLLRMVLAARHCREHATRLRAVVAAALGETGGGQ